VFAAILVLFALPADGQQQEAGAKAQCAVFTIQDFSSGTENRDYEQPITASVSAAFEVGGYSVIPPAKWSIEAKKRTLDDRALLAESAAVSVAQAVGAALAVTGYFTVVDDQIYISLQCWDVSAGALAAGLQQTARFNIAFYSALHDRVTEMLPQILLAQRPAENGAGGVPLKRVPTLSNLTFVSPDEGMEVFLVDGTRVGAISNGKLVWKTPGIVLGSAFSVEKRKRGFDTSQETVRAATEIPLSRLVIEQKKAVEVDWTVGQLLGAGGAMRVYTRPDSTFFFLGNYLFVQPPLNSAGNPVFHYDLNAGVGTYLFLPPDAMVRLGVSTGAGVILSTLTGPTAVTYADPYLDVLNWWVETRALGPVIFLRQEWKFGTGGGASALGTGWIMVGNFPLVTLGVILRW
jgi:sporulation protein YlmC with PRC-barrel domain